MQEPFLHNGFSDGFNTYTGQIWLIPEPGTALLVAMGLLMLGAHPGRRSAVAFRAMKPLLTEAPSPHRARFQRRSGLTATVLVTLLLASPAAALPLLINNGLAPPNPENVIAGPLSGGAFDRPVLTVRNADCTDFTAPCPSPGDATTVELAPGANVTGIIDVRDSSRLEMSGGGLFGDVVLHDSADLSISDVPGSGTSFPRVIAGGSSHVSIMGGRLGRVDLYDTSAGVVAGGLFSNGLGTRGSSSLVYSGLGSDSLVARDSSSITMTGGGTNVLNAYDSASILLIGGFVADGISTGGDARVRIEGLSRPSCPTCALYLADLNVRDSSIVKVVGTDFAVDGVPVGFGLLAAQTGQLSGTLLSGSAFDQASHGERFFHNGYGGLFTGQIWLVPEPGTALLVAMGLLALGVRRRLPPRRHIRGDRTTSH